MPEGDCLGPGCSKPFCLRIEQGAMPIRFTCWVLTKVLMFSLAWEVESKEGGPGSQPGRKKSAAPKGRERIRCDICSPGHGEGSQGQMLGDCYRDQSVHVEEMYFPQERKERGNPGTTRLLAMEKRQSRRSPHSSAFPLSIDSYGFVLGYFRVGGHKGRYGHGLFNIIIILMNRKPRTLICLQVIERGPFGQEVMDEWRKPLGEGDVLKPEAGEVLPAMAGWALQSQ